MINQKKLIVSHAPFWHDGSRIVPRSYNMMIAALPAIFAGIYLYGFPALGVVALSISSAIFWELLMNKVMKRSVTIGDGNAALIGLVFAMLIPATFPWWAVLTGTFVAIVIGKQIFGGIGGNAFNPVAVSIAILMISWKDLFDFNETLASYTFNFEAAYPLASMKHFGIASIDHLTLIDLLIGKQTGGIGATCGLALIIGGFYLILRGFIRWEIVFSFLAGIFITALIFNLNNPNLYAGPAFHLLTGYTLAGAFFLAPEDSSSPVNFIPMLIYGAVCGLMTVLIRNIGAYVDGVIYAVLIANLMSPLLDKIRPKAMGKVV
ncbi:RnfABCDGE type electron transport complex subunit D [Desulfococcaceae bacterium HSG9]|nr:RnfABCDGE type electron transport complex subunit D [Desulfococcaceae bacterium HSG9]